MWYTDTLPPIPLGVYDHADDTPGVSSVEIPTGKISGTLRDATRFLERIDDAVPGLGDFFDLLP